MKLLDYLVREGMNASRLAERIGVPPSTITRLLHGRRPSWRIVAKISEATGGEVARPEDFVTDGEDHGSSAGAVA